MKGKDTADGFDLAGALTEGVEAAYKAVMKPAEVTILTVSRVSAEAATRLAPRPTTWNPFWTLPLSAQRQPWRRPSTKTPC